ncbi:MAG: hypothetical protein H7343_11115 [Undibacterium sp.]|nr:hypothetical protein [Opitutaceae bacterium]
MAISQNTFTGSAICAAAIPGLIPLRHVSFVSDSAAPAASTDDSLPDA